MEQLPNTTLPHFEGYQLLPVMRPSRHAPKPGRLSWWVWVLIGAGLPVVAALVGLVLYVRSLAPYLDGFLPS